MRRWGASTVARRTVLAALLVAVAASAAGCSAEPPPLQARGLVLGVQAATFSQVASFVLRTDDGTTLDFVVEGDIGMTAGHLREHGALGEPVTVTYRREGDLLIATRVDD